MFPTMYFLFHSFSLKYPLAQINLLMWEREFQSLAETPNSIHEKEKEAKKERLAY